MNTTRRRSSPASRLESSYLLGLDIGTSGCKAVALGLDGIVLSTTEARYPISSPQPGWAEQDPDSWWRAIQSACVELTSKLGHLAEPLGVSVTGQMHTLVGLDSKQDPIRPAILWSDQRSLAAAQDISKRVGAERILEITRNPSRAAFTASKLDWLRQHEPVSLHAIRHVLLPKDWIVFLLTGEFSTEPSDASGTGLFDVRSGTWSTDLLDALDFSESLFPSVVSSTTIVGPLQPSAAAHLGLPSGIPVIAGAGDQAAAAYDVGATRSGVVACNLGTSIALMMSVAEPIVGSLSHVVPGQWLFLTSAHSGTVALDWWARVSGDQGVSKILEYAGQSSQGARGARFIPRLLGSRDSGTHVTGSFTGLREDHSRADMARAVIEGVSLEVRNVADGLPASDLTPDWRVFGGGARGKLLVQTLADVMQTNLQLIPAASSARGAARLLGEALGEPVPLSSNDLDMIRPDPGSSYAKAIADYRNEVA